MKKQQIICDICRHSTEYNKDRQVKRCNNCGIMLLYGITARLQDVMPTQVSDEPKLKTRRDF